MNDSNPSNENDEYLHLKTVYGIDINTEQTFGFIDTKTIFYLVGCNFITYQIESMRQKIIPFRCSGRVEIIKITSNSKFAVLVDLDQKSSTILVLDLFDNDKKKVFKKSKLIEESIQSLSVSSDLELVACVTNNWNLLIISFNRLRILDQLKAVSSQAADSTIESVTFFPNDSKRLLLIGNKLIKIFLYTKKGLKFVYSLNCDFLLIKNSWLGKNETLSYDKLGNLFLIEPKQNLIRTIILNSMDKSDDLNSNFSDNKSETSLTESNYTQSDKSSVNSFEPISKTILKSSKIFEANVKYRQNSVFNQSVKCLASIHKGFFLCYKNDDQIYLYENSRNTFTFIQTCVLRLKKFEKYKQVDKSFKEVILNVQVNSDETYVVVLTNRKIVYYYDLNQLFVNNHKEVELEPVLDSFYSDYVTGLDYCIRKSIVAITTADRWLILWNYDTNTIELKQNFDEDLFTVAIHPSGLYLILATTNSLKYMSVYSETCKVIHVLNVHACKNCLFSYGGHLFAFIHGTIIQVYSSISFEEIGSIKSQDMGKIKQLRFSKDDHYLLCCSMAGIIRIWNSQTLILVNEITTKGLSYIGLDLHPNQEWLFLISTEKSIRQFQMIVSDEYRALIKPNAEASLIKKISTKPDENVTAIEISKSGKMICIGTNKGCIRIYSLIYNEGYKEYKAHFGSVNSICISYGDECLVTSADDGSIIFWNIANKFRDNFSEATQSNEEILIDKDDFITKSKVIATYEDKLQESRVETNFKLRMKELKFNIKKRELKKRFNNQMVEIMEKIEELEKEEDVKMNEFNLEYDQVVAEHMVKFEKIQFFYEQKLDFEENKNLELGSKIEHLRLEIEDNRNRLEELKQRTENIQYENIENKLKCIRDKGDIEFSKYEKQIEGLIKYEYDFEEEIENETTKEKTNFEMDLLRLINEAETIRSYIFDLRSDFKSVKNSIKTYLKTGYKPEVDIIELKNQIKSLEETEDSLKSEIDTKESGLKESEIEYEKLIRENEILELENSELSSKIDQAIKNKLEPIKFENKQLNIELNEIKKEIKQKMLDLNRLRHEAFQFKIRFNFRKKKNS